MEFFGNGFKIISRKNSQLVDNAQMKVTGKAIVSRKNIFWPQVLQTASKAFMLSFDHAARLLKHLNIEFGKLNFGKF